MDVGNELSSSSSDDEDNDVPRIYADWLADEQAHSVLKPQAQATAFCRNVAYQCNMAAYLYEALSIVEPHLEDLRQRGVETAHVRPEGLNEIVKLDLRQLGLHEDVGEQLWAAARDTCVRLCVAPHMWRWGCNGTANVNYGPLERVDLDTIDVLCKSYIIRSVQCLSAAGQSLRHKVNCWGFRHSKLASRWENLILARNGFGFGQNVHPNYYPTNRVPPPARKDRQGQERRRAANAQPLGRASRSSTSTSSSSEQELAQSSALSGTPSAQAS